MNHHRKMDVGGGSLTILFLSFFFVFPDASTIEEVTTSPNNKNGNRLQWIRMLGGWMLQEWVDADVDERWFEMMIDRGQDFQSNPESASFHQIKYSSIVMTKISSLDLLFVEDSDDAYHLPDDIIEELLYIF